MTGPFRPAACVGEVCACGQPAAHKLEEVIFDDDPQPARHPLTRYVCPDCFQHVMRPYEFRVNPDGWGDGELREIGTSFTPGTLIYDAVRAGMRAQRHPRRLNAEDAAKWGPLANRLAWMLAKALDRCREDR